jgi:protein CpxP
MIKLIDRNVSKLTIAAVVAGGILLVQPVYAADAPAAPATTTTTTTTTAPAAAAKAESGEDRVATHIKTLHDKLKITADQEPQFEVVASVMRDNEKVVHELAEARHENENATAIDDLKSYKKIADAHAAGIAKLIPAFEDLYSKMSPEQKANADTVFGKYEGHEGHMDKADKKG